MISSQPASAKPDRGH